MPNPTFVIPADLELQLTDSEISFEYDGDVVLEGTLGRSIGKIKATGDITLTLPLITGSLQAGGTITLNGNTRAKTIRATNVVFEGKRLEARGIQASQKIIIAKTVLQCDALVAPEIQIAAQTTGRSTIIECNNERGATKVKGGLSLADYEDMFGGAETFMKSRGLVLVSGAQPLVPLATSFSTEEYEEDTDDPLSLSMDDLEPLGDLETLDDDDIEAVEVVSATPSSSSTVPDDVHARMLDALGRITKQYEGKGGLPPAVEELAHLLEGRDYNALQQAIPDVWNGLLAYHNARGEGPHPRVTHAFNVIHGLLAS